MRTQQPHVFVILFAVVWASGAFFGQQASDMLLRHKTAPIEALPSEDFMEYDYVRGDKKFIALTQRMWWYSSSTIKRLPLRVGWDEIIECDYTPFDGVDVYQHFASGNSFRTYDATGKRAGRFPFRGKYVHKIDDDRLKRDIDEELNPVVRAPDVPSRCRMLSEVDLRVELGVMKRFHLVSSDVYVGITPKQLREFTRSNKQ